MSSSECRRREVTAQSYRIPTLKNKNTIKSQNEITIVGEYKYERQRVCEHGHIFLSPNNKLNCRWQTARRICANAMAWVADLIKTPPPHVCYHAKFGSSTSKVVRINWRDLPKLVALGPAPCVRGVADPLKTSPLPYIYVTTSNLVVLRQRVYA